jgi:hypothetical protein
MRPQIRSYELLVFVFVPKCLELLRASKLWSAADLKQHASGAFQTPIQSIENLSNSVLLLLEDNCNLWIPLVLTGVHEIFKTQHGLSGFIYVGSCSCLIRFAPKILFFVFNLSNTLLFLLFLWAFTSITVSFSGIVWRLTSGPDVLTKWFHVLAGALIFVCTVMRQGFRTGTPHCEH